MTAQNNIGNIIKEMSCLCMKYAIFVQRYVGISASNNNVAQVQLLMHFH